MAFVNILQSRKLYLIGIGSTAHVHEKISDIFVEFVQQATNLEYKKVLLE
jgi:polyhydroxyalkanoate synthesis regulator phasin